MTDQSLSPRTIFELSTGHWAAATLAGGVTHKVFEHLENGGLSPDELSQRAGLAVRGSQALLDGLLGIGLITRDTDGIYHNTAEARTYLIPGRTTYLGGFVEVHATMMGTWTRLPEAVHDGEAPEAPDDVEEDPFWEELALSIAPLTRPAVRISAESLDLAAMSSPALLDVGGGLGVYSAEWLRINPTARASQVDWPNVNRMARDFVDEQGVGDRFDTIDGDFHEIDFGEGLYDVIVYSNIAHRETPESNRGIFKHLHRALRPGGVMVISDFILRDQRTGPSFALLYHVNMLLHSRGGATYTESEYRAWLSEADFSSVEVQRSPEIPSTLVYARK